MKKKHLLLTILTTICLASIAQQPPISHLEINNVRPTILGNGSCFVPQQTLHDENGNELPPTCTTWEVPVSSEKQTIFQHSLWFGGLDADETLHLAALRYGQGYDLYGGQDYWSGPLKPNDGSIDQMISMKYHHIWNLSRAEIEQFITNHGNAGYQIPEDILTWPAHGEEGYAQNLAPFVDVNSDGHYNPADGDYPDIKGDQCLFFIFNDHRPHTETAGAALDLEVQAMVYAFDAPNDEALSNTVFVKYKFFNRSNNNYYNTYLGLWTDWDLGYMYDDYVGCDVQRNSCFAYNGNAVDGNGESWAYGDNPPVQVLTVLNGPDGLGMTGFLCHYNDNSTIGDPRYAIDYYYYLQSIWRDGSHLRYGGTGFYDAVGPDCNYMFPGNSDPENIGTGGIAPNDGYNTNGKYWTEEQCGNPPGDRRGLASVGPFDFPAGSMKELDYALITVWKNNSHSAMERKGEFIDHIKALFNNGFAH
ncbi:MAG: hypothetical protein IKM99_01500 [Bacteroidales bacterium]|nr:hypothetical protein [Bacteroidales bacterium]